jgi:predicted DNA-binding transcriptional regulator AlpA
MPSNTLCLVPAEPTSTPSAQPPGPLMVPARVAAATCSVSLATWHRWNAGARCPAPVRIGATVRWRVDELEDWIASGCPARKEWEAMRRAGGGRAS